ncbi:hypothetical protein [Paracoccus lutimaris]|nr:hypothetical protein [Paracoccus lutimaris]
MLVFAVIGPVTYACVFAIILLLEGGVVIIVLPFVIGLLALRLTR